MISVTTSKYSQLSFYEYILKNVQTHIQVYHFLKPQMVAYYTHRTMSHEVISLPGFNTMTMSTQYNIIDMLLHTGLLSNFLM